ncbi:MAG: Pectate lyase superfamily protein [Firmicutes bacterium ADurb.Bin300]|nr:MAG: Pectate lyase superfamily protein [Firmicutes bacterium ADurb.Bin300]HOD02732.1 right-handed parallel beta-helix repeat-containing protein [Clostridiales bacterium]
MNKTVFNILDFGAVGNGFTDCTKQIQRALDCASECRGKVIVPPGRYKVGKLKPGEGVLLEGSAAWSFRDYGASVFELCDETVDCMLDITNAFGCCIRAMSLNGNNLGKGIHGVLLSRTEYNGGGKEDTPCIEDCRIGNFSGDGVRLDKIWCFSVRHSMLCFNEGSGLYIDGWDGFILDNWFSANKDGGIKSENVAASLTITGNRVEWNENFGFSFCKGDSYNITGNFFDRSFGPALVLGKNKDKKVHTVTVTGNVFRRSGAQENNKRKHLSSHIYLRNCENTVVLGNSFRGGKNDDGKGKYSPDYGIVAENMTACIIKDNVLKDGFAVKDIEMIQDSSGSIVEENIG